MIVVGVDPSTTSTGLAEVVDGEMTDHAVWTPPKRSTRPAALRDYEDSFSEWIGDRPIDVAVVALPISRSHKVTRALALIESPTFIVLERRGVPVLEIKDGEARNWALGLPITSSKEQAHEEARRRYPNLRVPPSNQGGEDVLDAFVAALAAPEALKRVRR